MNKAKLFDLKGAIISLVLLVGATILFTYYTEAFFGSLAAAVLSAGLFFVSYTLIRWVYLAIRTKDE